MIWQLVPVLALAGFGFCIFWAHVLVLCGPVFRRIWRIPLPETPLLGGPPLYIRDGEHLPELLSYEREPAKAVNRPPQSVSGIIPYVDLPEKGCDFLPQERRVEVLRSGTFGHRPPYPTRIQIVYDDACLHAGYEVPDPRRKA